MDDKHITAGLTLLADDMAPLNVDIDEVIATARVRSKRRQAITASAAGTVGLIAALTAVLTSAGIGDRAPIQAPPSSSAPRTPVIVDGQRQATAGIDDRARKLTAQLADAKAGIIPADMRIEPDDRRNTKFIVGGAPPALQFVTLDFGDDRPLDYYTAFAKLTDEQGYGTLRISVGHGPVPGQDLTCHAPGKNCESRTFPDGTKATLNFFIGTATGWNQALSVLRPDGTRVDISCDVFDTGSGMTAPTRPTIPLSTDELFRFATVFTW